MFKLIKDIAGMLVIAVSIITSLLLVIKQEVETDLEESTKE